jgi:hypothetical protein
MQIKQWETSRVPSDPKMKSEKSFSPSSVCEIAIWICFFFSCFGLNPLRVRRLNRMYGTVMAQISKAEQKRSWIVRFDLEIVAMESVTVSLMILIFELMMILVVLSCYGFCCGGFGSERG